MGKTGSIIRGELERERDREMEGRTGVSGSDRDGKCLDEGMDGCTYQ